VALVALELRRLLEAHDLTVDSRAHETLLAKALEDRLVVALTVSNDRRAELQLLAGVVAQDLLHDRLRRT